MILPNFVVIGAGKSGTTSLYFYLQQHPEIFLPSVKELNFFAVEGEALRFFGPGDNHEAKNYFSIDTLDKYQALFESVKQEKAVGDISPFYIYSERAPVRIKNYIPEAKIIAILRNPVDRAYSNYLHLYRDGREKVSSFSEAIELETGRINKNWSPSWHYYNAGLYGKLLKRYYDKFDHDQIKVYLYDDYASEPEQVLKSIFQFLGVDYSFVPNLSTRYNSSGIPKNELVHQLLSDRNPVRNIAKKLLPESFTKMASSIRDKNLDKPPKMDSSTRETLLKYYEKDILELQDITHLDLSRWLI